MWGTYTLYNYRRGGYKNYVRKAISNLPHANIDVHSRRLIAELPGDGVKCISNIQYHCAKMTFAEKSVITGFFSRSHIKESNQQWNISRYFKMHSFYQSKWETVILRILICIFYWIAFTNVENILHIYQATRQSWEERKTLLTKNNYLFYLYRLII